MVIQLLNGYLNKIWDNVRCIKIDFISIYTHTYTYIHTYIHACIHIYIHGCLGGQMVSVAD